MKHILSFTCILAACLNANSQIGEVSKKTTNTSTQKMVGQPPHGLAIKLPDLKFTAVNVTATPSAPGATTYTLDISYTVKNDGTAAVFTNDVSLQGFLSNESWITNGNKDIHMSGYLEAAGGQLLSGRNEALAPGESRLVTYSLHDKQLSKDPNPIFIITINMGGGVKEFDYRNNMTYTIILL
jgi:hypothetical protein